MYQKAWPVLIIDDEPDVLEVTRLALKDITVDGVPLELLTARSKAEAIQILTQSSGPPVAPFVAIALIDVVMETDQAGLELCQFIRDNLKNKTTQLIIRTGQAGVAPEPSVVDRYDINGYFTKVEATQEKLYSMVKVGIRQHEFLTNSLILFHILAQAAGKSKSGIAQTMTRFSDYVRRNGVSVAIVVGREVLLNISDQSAPAVFERCRRLSRLSGEALSEHGDRFIAEDQSVLFRSNGRQSSEEAYLLFTGTGMPSPGLQLLYGSFLTALATLVKSGSSQTVVTA
jgi:CheY-like chemotaxis protein